jgi:hypothetical protein
MSTAGVRPQRTAAQGGYRLNDWYCDRVVRLLPLRDGSRAHFRQAVLSQFGSADGDARRLRNLFHRLCRAPDRRRDLRPLRRPYWPQGDADCNAVVHGHRHLPDRVRSDLRNSRYLGRGYPDVLRMIQGIGVGGEWAGPFCWRWNGRVTAASAAWWRPGHNSACRAACSWRILRCSPSVSCPAISSPPGAGAFPSRCRSFWSASACGSASAFSKRRYSRHF